MRYNTILQSRKNGYIGHNLRFRNRIFLQKFPQILRQIPNLSFLYQIDPILTEYCLIETLNFFSK